MAEANSARGEQLAAKRGRQPRTPGRPRTRQPHPRSASPDDAQSEYREREYIRDVKPIASPQVAPESETPDDLFVDEPQSTGTPATAGTDKVTKKPRGRPRRASAAASIKKARVLSPIDEDFPEAQSQDEKETYVINRTGGRTAPEKDLINIMIYDFKVKDNISWEEISGAVDNALIKKGLAPKRLSQAAIYGRWTRNAPKIAKAKGDVGFNKQDWLYMHRPQAFVNGAQYYTAPTSGLLDEAIPATIRNNVRIPATSEQDIEELETLDMTEALENAVDIVNKNFFIFVADEMERRTGKLYSAEALEARYEKLEEN